MKIKALLFFLFGWFLWLAPSTYSFALSGGPDGFGYMYEDSGLENWTDISKSGTHLNVVKDTISDPVWMGFDFEFYGNTYSDVSVASNGLITFSPKSYRRGYTSGQEIPTPGGYADNFIAGLWDYLSPNHT